MVDYAVQVLNARLEHIQDLIDADEEDLAQYNDHVAKTKDHIVELRKEMTQLKKSILLLGGSVKVTD